MVSLPFDQWAPYFTLLVQDKQHLRGVNGAGARLKSAQNTGHIQELEFFDDSEITVGGCISPD